MFGFYLIIYSILRSMYILFKLFCEYGKYENENYIKFNYVMKGIFVNWFMFFLIKFVIFVLL